MLTLVFIVIGFFIAHSFSVFYTTHRARYHVPAFAMSAIFLCWPLISLKKPFRLLKSISVSIAIITLFNTIVYNAYRPLIGQHAIWINDRVEQQGLYKIDRLLMFQTVNEVIPLNAVIGVSNITQQHIYPFFGPHFERQLVSIRPDEAFTSLRDLRETPTRFLLGTPPKTANTPLPEYLIVQDTVVNQLQDFSGFEEIIYVNDQYVFHYIGD